VTKNDTKISPGVLNSLFNSRLESDADKVTRDLQIYLEERVKYYDLKVTDVSVKKVADRVTISFRVGDGQVSRPHVVGWQEQELLSLNFPVTTILDRELKVAAEELRRAIS